MAERFACERRFVYGELCAFEKPRVGRHFVACAEQDDVAHNDVAPRHFRDCSVADDTNGFVVVDAVEHGEFAPGPLLENEGKPSGEKYSQYDAYGFEEHFESSAYGVFINRDSYAQHAGHAKDDYERV